jgi:quercetin dioxygenase-like cupin family protein
VFLPHAAGSQEYIAIVRGALRLTLDGQARDLEAGDSIFYPGACRHGFENPRRAVCDYYLAMHVAGDHVLDDSAEPRAVTIDAEDPV